MMMPKYKNKKVVVKNIKFDSKLESNIYLKILELFKTYKFAYELQPRYLLLDKFKLDGKAFIACTYRGDFDIVINDKTYTLDSKGIETDVFKLKKKMFAKRYGREIVCVKSVKQFTEWFENIAKENPNV